MGGRRLRAWHRRKRLCHALGARAADGDRQAVPGPQDQRRAHHRAAASRLRHRRHAARAGQARAARLQFLRRSRRVAGIRRPARRPHRLHRRLHLRDRPCRHPGRELGTDRGGDGARPAPRPRAAPRRAAAGAAGHRAADDEPISQPDQEQLARRGDRLPRSAIDRQHDDEPDRPSDRGHIPQHARLSDDQLADLALHELVQPVRQVGRAMSDMPALVSARQPERPRTATLGALGWLRAHLFNSIPNTILTLLAIFVIVKLVPPFIAWLLIDSKFVAANAKECREAAGACWAFIAEWYRFILFGRFPYAEQWRPLIVVFIFIAMFLASCNRRLWGRSLLAIWIGGAALVLLLMFGGRFGMGYFRTALWNGLPLTLILAVFGMLLAFPLAILLALGRRSHMPAVHSLSGAYIELIRGVPLITILVMASVMLPLFLPSCTTIDKLLALH